MKRRDALRELMNPTEPSEEGQPQPAPDISKRTEPVRPGALRTMGLSLKQMSAEADEARALRAQLEGGQQVVDLDPSLVDPSFVVDRIPVERDPGFDAFVEGIAQAGQQVPILVRPHPDKPGRYQTAYGHRRLRAAQALKRQVRAVVRRLTDAELVVAQGKENGDRRDLSFIERATFAAHLEERKFERSTIMTALGVDKSDLSRLIALARSVPAEVARAIGPAPKAGRPRWTQLAEAFAGRPDAGKVLSSVVAAQAFEAADSDRKFGLVLAALQTQPAKGDREAWRDREGRALVRIERSSAGTRLIVDERLAGGFGAFLIERLPELHEEFTRSAAHVGGAPAPGSRRAAKTSRSGGSSPAGSPRQVATRQGGAETD